MLCKNLISFHEIKMDNIDINHFDLRKRKIMRE